MKIYPIYTFKWLKGLPFCLGILILIVLFTSCEPKNARYSLSDDQFAIILADLHLAENLAANGTFDVKDSLSRHFFGEVFQIHHIDSLEIERNIALLKNDPKKMSVIYEKVLEVLKKKEAKDK